MSIELQVKAPVDPNNTSHYVNNADFKAALQDYAEKRDYAKKNGLPPPQIQNYLGECFLKIANGLASKHNFRNYSYVKDMVSDAVFICIKNIECYDVNKGTSAFAYFTQCVYFSFLGSIKKEKKEEKKKRDMFFKGEYDTFSMNGEDEEFAMSYTEFLKTLGTDSTPYVAPVPKTHKKKTGMLDSFVEGE